MEVMGYLAKKIFSTQGGHNFHKLTDLIVWRKSMRMNYKATSTI